MPSKAAKLLERFRDSEWVNKLKWSQAEECRQSLPVMKQEEKAVGKMPMSLINSTVDLKYRWMI